MLFYGKISAIFVFMFRKQLLCEFSHSCGEMSFSKKGMTGGLPSGKNFFEMSQLAELQKKKSYATNAFLWEKF